LFAGKEGIVFQEEVESLETLGVNNRKALPLYIPREAPLFNHNEEN
jgi:hypothetical protein